MFCMRRFHELITDFVRGAWLRYVRRFNGQVLGAPSDLDQFLFGAERAPLAKYLPILREVQEATLPLLRSARSRRQRRTLTTSFLGHGIRSTLVTTSSWLTLDVMARRPIISPRTRICVRWVERNRTAAAFLQERFDQGLIVHNEQNSERIARWAYSQGCCHTSAGLGTRSGVSANRRNIFAAALLTI